MSAVECVGELKPERLASTLLHLMEWLEGQDVTSAEVVEGAQLYVETGVGVFASVNS